MSHIPENKSSKDHDGTLFNLLEQRLEKHNKINPQTSVNDIDALKQYSNQFESLHRKRRKLSHGDLCPTPGNSPAMVQFRHKNQNQQHISYNAGHSFSHKPINKRLHDIVSPLRLAVSSRRIRTKLTKTPPVTPDSHNNTPVVTAIKNRFPASPLRISTDSLSSSSSLLISPDTRCMIINQSSHLHQPSSLSLSGGSFTDDIEYNYNDMETTVNVMPCHLHSDSVNMERNKNNKNKRLRSLSCSETSIFRKSRIMSPRLSAVPNSPVLKPIADGLRRYSFNDPTPLILPESPKSPKFRCRKTSVISPKCDEIEKKDDQFFVSSFNEKLDLHSYNDIIMDD